MEREQLLLRTLVGLAESLVSNFDVVEVLTLLSDRCVDALDVNAAGIMLASPAGALRVVASSSETMRTLELFEQQSSEGPCQDCFRSGSPVASSSFADMHARWPRFGPRAREAGFEAVHALPMHVRERTVGALNLFRTAATVIPQADLEAAQALADVATIAILQHRDAAAAHIVNEQLQQALNSRLTIEQAKGMLAERTGTHPEQAFQLLRGYARNRNRPIADVCLAVIDDTINTADLNPTQ
jgi:GAF domain-containing protein